MDQRIRTHDRRPTAGCLAAALILACVVILGCDRRPEPASAAPGAEPVEQVLLVYNWADYIGKNTIADFEKKTGIRVVYDVYESEMTLEAKLLAGDSGYDVVFPSMDYVARQIAAGIYAPLDKSRLSNWDNLDPQVLKVFARADPFNRHAVPYLHAVTGFIYNTDRVHERMPDAPIDSLDMIFDPKVLSRFADCGVSFLDSAQDVIALALRYLKLDPNTSRPEDFKAAEQLILGVRPYVRTFDSSGQINQLANGELCVAMAWSGDYAISMARAQAAGIQVSLAFTIPREGANISYNAMLIPADAPHVALAHRFIDYLLDARVIAQVTSDLYFGNDNAAATPFVRPAILNNPVLYPTPELASRLFQAGMGTPSTERLRTRTWTRIRTQE